MQITINNSHADAVTNSIPQNIKNEGENTMNNNNLKSAIGMIPNPSNPNREKIENFLREQASEMGFCLSHMIYGNPEIWESENLSSYVDIGPAGLEHLYEIIEDDLYIQAADFLITDTKNQYGAIFSFFGDDVEEYMEIYTQYRIRPRKEKTSKRITWRHPSYWGETYLTDENPLHLPIIFHSDGNQVKDDIISEFYFSSRPLVDTLADAIGYIRQQPDADAQKAEVLDLFFEARILGYEVIDLQSPDSNEFVKEWFENSENRFVLLPVLPESSPKAPAQFSFYRQCISEWSWENVALRNNIAVCKYEQDMSAE